MCTISKKPPLERRASAVEVFASDVPHYFLKLSSLTRISSLSIATRLSNRLDKSMELPEAARAASR